MLEANYRRDTEERSYFKNNFKKNRDISDYNRFKVNIYILCAHRYFYQQQKAN